MQNFDITSNPFHLLGVSVRSTRAEIADAYEDAHTDGKHDEQTILQAHQALIGLKTRLEAELSWLLEPSPSHVRDLVKLIETASDASKITDETEDLTGIDAANIFATLCHRFPGKRLIVERLIEAYGDISSDHAIKAANENRSVSGFPKIDPSLVAEILPRITESHARAALQSISCAEHSGNLMTEIVEDFISSTGEEHEFLDRVVRYYDSWSEPQLRKIKDQIDQANQYLRKDSNAKEPVEKIVRLLTEWDEYSQPRQLMEQEKGLDEQRSKDLYEELRELTLWLANEQNEHESALKISKALLKTFPELPSVAIQAADDINALESLIQDAQSLELFAPLISAVERALADLDAFDGDLLKKGFSSEGKGLARILYQAFAEAVGAAEGTEHENIPWMLVRGVAIELNNTESLAESALSILRVLDKYKDSTPPPKARKQLDIDLATVHQNLMWESFNRALGRSDFKKALRLANELLEQTDDKEKRQSILQITTTIEQRIKSGRRRFFWWAAAAIVGFVWLSNDSGSQKKRPYSPSYTSPEISSVKTGAIEDSPPVGKDRILTTNQVRYCVFQGKRIENLNTMVNRNNEINKFNSLINSYNMRCSSYRYYRGTLQKIEKELNNEGYRLRNEAREIFNSWNSSSPKFIDTFLNPDSVKYLLNPLSKNDARIIQLRLSKLGYYASTIDGIWGPGSKLALKNFKIQNGLGPSNKWDIETQRYLFSE